MKILITGHTGFVGTNLIESLSGHELCFVSARTSELPNWYKWSELDQCMNVDCVIHLAGKAHDTADATVEEDYMNVNLGLTRVIFDYFMKSRATKFIFFSSVKAVADKVGPGILMEDRIPEPSTPYGKSKLAAEKYIQNQCVSEPKIVYILRPCMIHGPHNKGNLNFLYKLISRNIPWPLGAFHNARSFCGIANLCFVVKQLIDRNDIPGGVYNVADDQPISTNELVSIIAASQNKKATVLKISKRLITLIAKAGDIIKLPLNSQRLQKLTENYTVSNAKIIAAMQKQLPLTSRQGLINTFISFRKS